MSTWQIEAVELDLGALRLCVRNLGSWGCFVHLDGYGKAELAGERYFPTLAEAQAAGHAWLATRGAIEPWLALVKFYSFDRTGRGAGWRRLRKLHEAQRQIREALHHG